MLESTVLVGIGVIRDAVCQSNPWSQKWRRLYYIRRKVAFTQVFASHDDRGSAPTDNAAVVHPLYGTTAQPTVAMQARHFHHAGQATPTAAVTVEMPWEAELDPFVVHKRGPSDASLPHFTRGTTPVCMTSVCGALINCKAPGPDQLPDELLRHVRFSVQMHDLLFSFLRMCWVQGMTPGTWKNSITLLFYKKGDLPDPANCRPIAWLNSVYKLWTSIIPRVLPS